MRLRLVSHWRRSWCQVSVVLRWQLASCWCVLQITIQVHLKGTKELKSTGLHSANCTCNGLCFCDWEVMDHPSYSPIFTPSHFHLTVLYRNLHLSHLKQLYPSWSSFLHCLLPDNVDWLVCRTVNCQCRCGGHLWAPSEKGKLVIGLEVDHICVTCSSLCMESHHLFSVM